MFGANTFRSLKIYNYRLWAGGALISNSGAWMQRTAQDWIVLTELTHHDVTSVGVVVGLQFAPTVALLPFTGYVADRFERRKILLVTQSLMGIVALGLALLKLTGLLQLWHVYGFALALGCIGAFDSPASQAFASELVEESHLPNAVALNSTVFNLARMLGPAVAGVLLGVIGSGPVFLVNAFSFLGPITALALMRKAELRPRPPASKRRGGLLAGFGYVWRRPDLSAVMLMLFLIGTFGLNFPIFTSAMSVNVFHEDAAHYGLLTSAIALGSVVGALWAAGWERPRFTYLLASSLIFGAGFLLAAASPNYWLFGAVLVSLGVSTQMFTKTAIGWVQLETEPAMRGRVLALMMAIAFGGAPIGAPIVGWVAQTLGPRWSLVVGAASGLSAAGVALWRIRARNREAAEIRAATPAE
jgi:MFS family permease